MRAFPCFFVIFPFIIFVIIPSSSLGFDFDVNLENTNIFSTNENNDISDFNRIRLSGQIESEKIDGFAITVMIDNRTDYSETEDLFENELVLHRATVEYGTDTYLLIAGRQRIPFGVGRVWNPIDAFNPIDATSIETNEREGVDSFRLEYALSDLSNLDVTFASEKIAARLKGFFGVTDIALVTVFDDDQERIIIGWELEGELADSGLDLRSEGGLFYDQTTEEYHTSFIVGGEYGFSNSLSLLAEYHYSDEENLDQLGLTLGYQFSTLLSLNLLTIVDLNDNSSLFSPTLTYSLSDEMTLSGGFFLYNGGVGDYFGEGEELFFLRWFVHF